MKIKLKRYINRSNRILLAYERKFAKEIRKALVEQLKDYSTTLVLNDYLTPIFEKLYLDVGARYYQSQMKLIEDNTRKSLFLDNFKIWFSSYVENVIGVKVTAINQTTLMKLQEALGDLIPQSLEFQTMVKKLTKDFAFSAKRALMISRTEVGNAMNKAKEKSVEDLQVQDEMYKIWIHRGADNPRDWHLALDNGQAIPINQPFMVVDDMGNIEMMSRPHDENGSAHNVINCGCEILYMTETFARENGYL